MADNKALKKENLMYEKMSKEIIEFLMSSKENKTKIVFLHVLDNKRNVYQSKKNVKKTYEFNSFDPDRLIELTSKNLRLMGYLKKFQLTYRYSSSGTENFVVCMKE